MKPLSSSAIALSVVLHLILIIALVFGSSAHELPKPKPVASTVQPIQAVVLDKSKVEAHINKIKRQNQDESKRLKKLEQRAEAAKRKRAKEERRIKNLEKQRKKKELEKKKADAAAKKAKSKAAAAEKIRKKKEQEKKKADIAAKKAKEQRIKEEKAAQHAKEKREKLEQERKQKALEAKERALEQKLIEEQMAKEFAERQFAKKQQVMSEVDRYRGLIDQTIKRHLIIDKSTMAGKSCRIVVKLAPSGFVTQVEASNGDASVCAAAKTAVLKANTLPVSKDPDVFKELSTFGLTVAPEF